MTFAEKWTKSIRFDDTKKGKHAKMATRCVHVAASANGASGRSFNWLLLRRWASPT